MKREDYDFAISCYLQSLFYNRSTEHIVKLIEEVIGRINDTFKSCDWTDEGDIFYGMIVIMTGDYGTSPRCGWINEDELLDVLKVLNEELHEYKETLAREIEFKSEV